MVVVVVVVLVVLVVVKFTVNVELATDPVKASFSSSAVEELVGAAVGVSLEESLFSGVLVALLPSSTGEFVTDCLTVVGPWMVVAYESDCLVAGAGEAGAAERA